MGEQESITCPECGRTSYNPNDIEFGYCGYCHWWTSDPLLAHHNPNAESRARRMYFAKLRLRLALWLLVGAAFGYLLVAPFTRFFVTLHPAVTLVGLILSLALLAWQLTETRRQAQVAKNQRAEIARLATETIARARRNAENNNGD